MTAKSDDPVESPSKETPKFAGLTLMQQLKQTQTERDFLQSNLKVQQKQIAKLKASIESIATLFGREIETITNEVEALDERCQIFDLASDPRPEIAELAKKSLSSNYSPHLQYCCY